MLDVVNLVRTTGPGELLGPGTLLHAALAAAEFGAEVRGQEGDDEADFAEEGLEDGEAAAGYGEVDFDGPVSGCWIRTAVVRKGEMAKTYIQILSSVTPQLKSEPPEGEYSSYCLIMAMAQILSFVSVMASTVTRG